MKNNGHIAIIGAGLMGHGIAQVFAVAGHIVMVHDVNVDSLSTLRSRIAQNLRDLGQDVAAAERVFPVEDFGECVTGAHVVFEAGPEDMAFKRKVFQRLELMAPRTALLASNTSVMPITDIMQGLKTGDRAMGTHWWNPPYLVPLVEVIKTAETDQGCAQQMFDLLKAVGKTPAMVKKDVAGFIGNRLQHALWREAISLVEHGICDAETVDTVVKASFGRRLPVIGPLENADLVGLDLTLAIHQTVLPAIEHTPGPSPYLQQLIAEGRMGMKTGEGFRPWTTEEQAQLRLRVLNHLKAMNAAEGR
ncbi:MAG: 3-hydroxyacyl-CoA dehydrogenase family protein [Hydrogenophaga sp.]|uniref:3-hydroxyacyl-CoA dehydrogenase family protein n=1 Tax=Hydrogenophaga sp. TaxID=1904254 RepID=UPI00271CF99E|nr:3-hydroxyacyl-CoA dehydrogenase family protein [Hydrogenophaga sp.]MDO9481951.1 3-hydroxyacyl-CoA dehydrogenase family protein [Hydrogenophaga sp.]MDP3345884.1 3-hydroxyacyl-CoA dehydrogenase family protein [Hydrogenophaga sp.]MDP3807771.1 3-hydroxyacyl-CoA dehydrogenase family protein [Hydrogenophaga sp.]